jgi:hypothetical protein
MVCPTPSFSFFLERMTIGFDRKLHANAERYEATDTWVAGRVDEAGGDLR